MKAIVTTAIISLSVLFSGLVQAAPSTSFKFVAENQNAESNLCVVAIEQGVSEMKKQAKAQEIDAKQLYCNGKPIARFIRKYNPTATSKEIFSVSAW